PVEVPLQLDDALAGVEPHGLDQIKILGLAPHEIPLQKALGPFIAWDAVDHKPRTEAKPRFRRSMPPFKRADQHVEGRVSRLTMMGRLDPSHRAGIGLARLRLECG